MTLTFQHATVHKTMDALAQTRTHTAVSSAVDKLACHRLSARAQRALVGAEEQALESCQGVTNNCSSLDMQNGPRVNLPD